MRRTTNAVRYLHVVYTVPPYLKVRYSNLGALYEPGGIYVLPALKLHNRDGTFLVKPRKHADADSG